MGIWENDVECALAGIGSNRMVLYEIGMQASIHENGTALVRGYPNAGMEVQL